LTAQTNATIHPITDHPRKRFSSKIAVVSRLLRAKAIIEGRKYITKPKPKMGKKKTPGRSMAFSSLICSLAPSDTGTACLFPWFPS
jgi:hypothetical protein